MYSTDRQTDREGERAMFNAPFMERELNNVLIMLSSIMWK